MKHLLFFIFSFSSLLASAKTSIDYKYILFEKFTGSWCNTCPGSELGTMEMLDSGLNVAVVAYQLNERQADVAKYYTQTVLDRAYFYDTIYAIPKTFFNGNLSNSSGSQTTSSYHSYKKLYDSCTKQKTNYDLSIEAKSRHYMNLKSDSLFINITTKRLATDTVKNMALRVVITQNHIEKKWYQFNELNHVMIDMLPDANGTSIDFSNEAEQNFKFALSIQDSSNIPLENLQIVAFLQEYEFLGYDTTFYSENNFLIHKKINRQVHQTDICLIEKDPINLENTNKIDSFRVYPNPSARGVFYFQNSLKNTEYRIFDIQGKELFKISKNALSVDISSYPKGIYFLNVSSEGRISQTIKLIY